MKELKSHFHIHRFLQEDPRPAVILYVGGNHPQSDQMLLILDALRKRYDGQVRCGFANVSRLIAARRALKIDAIPLVWLVENGKIVEVLKGVDAKLLSSKVAALLDGQLVKASSETAPDGQLVKASSETAAAAEQYDVDAMLKEATELAKQRVKQMIQDELLLLVGPGSTVEDDAKKLREEHDLDRLNVVITIGTGLVEVDEEIGEAFCEEYGGWHEESYIFIEGDKVDRDELFGTQFQTTYLPRLKAANEKMTQRLNTKIQALINQAPIMLFMKGTKERPFCKFSKEIVRILNEAGVEYDYFNIFTDDAIREGLKKYSRWPTYPQLYVKGELVGGLDIIKQMIQDMNGVAGLKDALLQIPV